MRNRWLSCLISLLFLLVYSSSAQAEDELLTIYLPKFTHGSGQEEFCAYASGLMQRAGYEVAFEVYNPSSKDYLTEYTEFMIDCSADPNCAFVAPLPVLETLLNEGWFEEMLPTDLAVKPANHTALLIRNDLLQAYGQPIRNASALEDWLYLRQSETGGTPLAAAPFLYDRMYGGYMWLDLFLPEEGFYALNNEFDSPFLADFYTSSDGYDFYGLYDLPALPDCVDRYLDWREYRLIDHYTLRGTVDLSGYDALLVNTEDFLSPLMIANNPPLAALDFTDYSLQILYSEELPAMAGETTPESQYGVCASEAAQERLYAFMDWISSPAGYLLLRYGEEGVDYSMGDGLLIPSDASDYLLWEQRVLFLHDELEPVLLNENLPVNFREEMELLRSAPEPPYEKEAFDRIDRELTDRGEFELLARLASDNHSFCEKLYAKDYLPSDRELAERWVENVQAAQSSYLPSISLLREYLTP